MLKGHGGGGRKDLQEVSLCPLVTLELVTPYFLQFNYARTPAHTHMRNVDTLFPSYFTLYSQRTFHCHGLFYNGQTYGKA